MNKSMILALTSLTMVALLDAQNLSSSDKSFIETAAKGGMHEVHMGQVGVQKSTSEKVKRYAQMIVTDHTKANTQLTALAKKKGVGLPPESQSASKHGETMDMPFASKTGKDFDMAYTMAMVEDHQKDIATFEKASQTSDDPELKAWASQMLPTLRKHLKAAETLHKASM